MKEVQPKPKISQKSSRLIERKRTLLKNGLTLRKSEEQLTTTDM